MGWRGDVIVAETNGTAVADGAGTNYVVQTPSGVLYSVITNSGIDVAFRKSADGGVTWSAQTAIFTGTTTGVSVWYDRWSNINAGLIHIAYTESASDDTLYRTIDTESSDALSTQTTIFAGTSQANGGHLSIARAVGGNVYCKTCIDAGAEGGFFRLPNANVPNGAWDAARTVDEALATTDQMILLPDYDAADTQDMLAIFWDASANEISRKLYDDSANSWAETSISGSMSDVAATNWFPLFAVAPDPTNTRHILIAWSAGDTSGADLRCWIVDSGAITEVTNVVTDSTDDQGLAAICIDTYNGTWWAIYAGKSDGSETALTAVNLYCKASTDSGATWGPETLLTTAARDVRWLVTVPRTLYPMATPPIAVFHDNLVGGDEIRANVSLRQPTAGFSLGI
jgi:hypothetical protein